MLDCIVYDDNCKALSSAFNPYPSRKSKCCQCSFLLSHLANKKYTEFRHFQLLLIFNNKTSIPMFQFQQGLLRCGSRNRLPRLTESETSRYLVIPIHPLLISAAIYAVLSSNHHIKSINVINVLYVQSPAVHSNEPPIQNTVGVTYFMHYGSLNSVFLL